MPATRSLCTPAILLLLVVSSARAEEPAADAASETPVSFYHQVRPILQEHCHGCHQPAKPLGGLVLTTFEAMQKGGDSQEPAVVPGKPGDSYLMYQILPDGDDAPLMPQDAEPLHAADVDIIRRWIAEGAKDDTPEGATVAVDMQHPPRYASPPVLTSLDFSPDGKLLAVSGYHEVLLHEADGGKLLARLVGMSERIESAVFSPDGTRLAVSGGSPGRFGEVQVWDVAKRELLLSVPVTFDTVYGASWSKDGTRIAFGCSDKTVRAIDATSGEQVLFQGAHTDWALDTVWSTDDSHLVSVSRDRTMKLTEVATERFVDDITSITPGALKGGLICVTRHPARDELLCGGADGVPKLYKMYRTQDRKIGDDFNLIRAYEAMPGRVFACAFNADGSRLVVGSSDDGAGEVRVYQTDDAKLVWKLDSSGGIYAVAFHPGGKQVAVAGFDGMVRLLSAAHGKLIREFVPVPIGTEVAAAK